MVSGEAGCFFGFGFSLPSLPQPGEQQLASYESARPAQSVPQAWPWPQAPSPCPWGGWRGLQAQAGSLPTPKEVSAGATQQW